MRAGILIMTLTVGLTALVAAKAADEVVPPQANKEGAQDVVFELAQSAQAESKP